MARAISRTTASSSGVGATWMRVPSPSAARTSSASAGVPTRMRSGRRAGPIIGRWMAVSKVSRKAAGDSVGCTSALPTISPYGRWSPRTMSGR
jgi:hypothetical protein